MSLPIFSAIFSVFALYEESNLSSLLDLEAVTNCGHDVLGPTMANRALVSMYDAQNTEI
jgi:hypothetical protein